MSGKGSTSEDEFLKKLSKKGSEICASLALIKKSRNWMAKELGMSEPTFRRKLISGEFKDDEAKLLKRIFNREFVTVNK